MSRLPARPGLLGAAGGLLAVSVGLPWGTVAAAASSPGSAGTPVTGASHPMRLIGLLAALVLAWAIRRGSRQAGWAAIGIAALALPTGLDPGHPGAGRMCYLLAIMLAAAGAGLVRPRPPVTSRERPAEGR
jgi:hypothetical protein